MIRSTSTCGLIAPGLPPGPRSRRASPPGRPPPGRGESCIRTRAGWNGILSPGTALASPGRDRLHVVRVTEVPSSKAKGVLEQDLHGIRQLAVSTFCCRASSRWISTLRPETSSSGALRRNQRSHMQYAATSALVGLRRRARRRSARRRCVGCTGGELRVAVSDSLRKRWRRGATRDSLRCARSRATAARPCRASSSDHRRRLHLGVGPHTRSAHESGRNDRDATPSARKSRASRRQSPAANFVEL